MIGIAQLVPGLKVLGTAITLRFVPSREDVGIDPLDRRDLADLQAVEFVQPGDVIVTDVGGDCGGSTFGDVILAGAQSRGCGGIVVDGAVRDLPFLKDMDVPVFAKGIHAAPGPRAIWPADWNVPIRCGGVLVLPGDVILGDEDGVVVIPQDAIARVIELGLDEQDVEEWVKRKVLSERVPVGYYYPPNPRTRADMAKDRRR